MYCEPVNWMDVSEGLDRIGPGCPKVGEPVTVPVYPFPDESATVEPVVSLSLYQAEGE
jgi:hypothetical protein